MDVTRVRAALELIELLHVTGGQAVQYSTDLFVPGSIDLDVIRGLRFEGGPADVITGPVAACMSRCTMST
jgi:hypothetical protein